jgi:hypothetical protein
LAQDTFDSLITTIQSLYQQLVAENTTFYWGQLRRVLAQASGEDARSILTAPQTQALCPHLRALRASYEYRRNQL